MWHFLEILLPPPDIRELLSTQKEANDLSLSPDYEFGHFDPKHRCFMELYNHGLLQSPQPKRVPGLPLGYCAGSFNNLVPRGTTLSITDVTAKVFFEHLYLVLGLWAPSQLSLCTHTPTNHFTAISRFPCNFFPKWPLIFFLLSFHQLIFLCPSN